MYKYHKAPCNTDSVTHTAAAVYNRVGEADMRESRRGNSMLAEEVNALKSVIKGKDGEMQREINNLLIKMKGL